MFTTTTILTCALALSAGEKFELGRKLLSIDASQAANLTAATLPAALQEARTRHARSLLGLDLDTYALAEAGVVLFTRTDGADARWITALLQQASRAFADKYGVTPADPAEPLVVFHFREAAAHEEFLAGLVLEHPYLESWLPHASERNAFSLYEPPMVVLLEDAHCNGNTSRDNILVHLIGHLELYRHFGLQPFWVREATGMDLEVTLLDRLYPGCSSEEFVVKGNDGAWRADVARAWKKGTPDTLDVIVTGLEGACPKEQALQALGLVRYLLAERPELLREFLSALADEQERLGLRNSVVEPAVQAGVLRQLLGEDGLERACRVMRRSEKRFRGSAEELWRQELKEARAAARSGRR